MKNNNNKLTPYEAEQLSAVKKWKAAEPGAVSKAIGKLTGSVAWLAEKIVPKKAAAAAVSAVSWAAGKLADKGDILRDGGVRSIGELRHKDLELSDGLAEEVHNWAVGIAAAEGGASGALGAPAIPADIAAIITQAMRAVHKIGYCFGYESDTENEKRYMLGILAAAGANSIKEKVDALLMLKGLQQLILKTSWKTMAQKAAQQQLSKEGALVAIRKLLSDIGVNLTKRKALQAIPIIGGGVGALMNGSYINDVCWAARRMYQERWLLENGKMARAV
jgi:hypothetical protein